MMPENRPLSPPAMAALVLFWQEPTDRALAGWNPYGGIIQGVGMAKLEFWLSEQLRMTIDESDAWRRSQVSAARGLAMYRILVTASRDWDDWDLVDFVLTSAGGSHLPAVTIVHGGCPSGGDPMADRWARDHGLRPERHPADWHSYGKSAGPRRNAFMVGRGADLCLAFIRNHSRGATGCADLAEAYGIKTVRYHSGRVPAGPAGGD